MFLRAASFCTRRRRRSPNLVTFSRPRRWNSGKLGSAPSSVNPESDLLPGTEFSAPFFQQPVYVAANGQQASSSSSNGSTSHEEKDVGSSDVLQATPTERKTPASERSERRQKKPQKPGAGHLKSTNGSGDHNETDPISDAVEATVKKPIKARAKHVKPTTNTLAMDEERPSLSEFEGQGPEEPDTQPLESTGRDALKPGVLRSKRLAGRYVLVTGGSSGIGFAISRRFLLEGADHVVIWGSSKESVNKAIEELKEQTGYGEDAPISGIHEDIRNRKSALRNILEDDVAFSQRKFRRLNTLVNCAGIAQYSFLSDYSSTAEIPTIITANLAGTIYTSQAFVAMWFHAHKETRRAQAKEKKLAKINGKPAPNSSSTGELVGPPSGCIINIGSLFGTKGGVGATAYAATKAGIIGFTRALAAESAEMVRKNLFGKPVRVNAIVPGYTETRMTEGLSQYEKQQLQAQIPMGRFGTPEEIADAAVFLATNEYANNCVLNLDGGLSAM